MSNRYTLDEYQVDAMSFRLESADERYALDNLVGEVGELFSLLAKARRDGRKMEHDQLLKKELGDIMWSLAAISIDNGFTLSDVCNANIYKLTSRKQLGTLQGSGDNR